MTDTRTKQGQRRDTLRATLDITDRSNQGIVHGRPEGMHPRTLFIRFSRDHYHAAHFIGSQPSPAPVTLDSVVDPDASVDVSVQQDPSAPSTLVGATSKDVYRGLGVPVQGMSSRELRHDGQPGRKRHNEGVEQFGEGEIYEAHQSAGAHKVDEASENRFVTPKSEVQGKV